MHEDDVCVAYNEGQPKEPEHHAIPGLPWEPGALPTRGQLARMSPGCMTPEELKRAWRELVGSKPLLALGHLVGKPWPPEPE